jgi:hypothetical protein
VGNNFALAPERILEIGDKTLVSRYILKRSRVEQAALEGDILVKATLIGHVSNPGFLFIGHGTTQNGYRAAVGFDDPA